MNFPGDNRQVALLKSLRTNNRFYTLVSPDSAYRNAGTIPFFPDDLTLGIAYPCLEDGLNDFAVIRTTFETIDVFPEDEALCGEMMTIINDARLNLRLRLAELRDRVEAGQAHFLGTDLHEFKESVLHLVDRGAIRRTLDNMMKLDVFGSVADHEATVAEASVPEPMYRYDFTDTYPVPEMRPLEPRTFIARLFDDVLVAVEDHANYETKYLFDRNVFQKFISVMFVNYATTDPMFYGTNRADYGVSGEKEMGDTPLYRAVAGALRQLERGVIPGHAQSGLFEGALGPAAPTVEDVTAIFEALPDLRTLAEPPHQPRLVELPAFGTERMLTEPFISIADALRLLQAVEHPRGAECAQLIGRAAHQLFERLRELGILSPVAENPVPPEG